MRGERIETLEGLPILDVGGVDLTRRPHPLWSQLARGLPDRTAVVFCPELRTGWRCEGREIIGGWVVLRIGSRPMPAWTSVSGIASKSGTTRGWRAFWPARVPSEAVCDDPDEIGRPYFLHRPDEVQAAMRVLREATAWSAADVPRVAQMHRNASRAAKRRMVEKQSEADRAAMAPLIQAAARAWRDSRGTAPSPDRRAYGKVMDAREVEADARMDFVTAPTPESSARYNAAMTATQHAETELRRG